MDRTESTVRLRTRARAIAIAGDGAKLAAFLGFAACEIEKWQRRDGELPSAVFLALVDIVAANRLTEKALRTLHEETGRGRLAPRAK